ncbi:MAG: FAD-binding protein [Deltaproteobacteria bacterium]|nr:FAD-binding protein [Deltaproteobacteria bacterium]
MSFRNVKTERCDVLIVGGGGAGLRAAIEARQRGVTVTVVSKSRVGYGNNTYISKGTFAAATGWRDSRDNPDAHLRDSIIGGRFINDQRLLRMVTQKAVDQIEFLQGCGVRFSEWGDKIRVVRTPGHSYPRHVRSQDRSGRDFMIPLRAHAERIGVRLMDRVFITRLASSGGRIAGAIGITHDGTLLTLAANCIVLATGGFARAYLHNNNAAGMTGDGHALAFELGVPLKDMEFIQFYPTALGALGSRLFLYEAFIFQAGAVLRNARGDDIIAKYGLDDPMAMTRDRLTRAVMREILEDRGIRGGVIVDLSTIPEEELAPLHHLLPAAHMTGGKELVVSPTAHFCMGGISIDENAETIVPGLFAAGEVCAGVHGANRLGGNALTEAFALGGVAGERAAQRARESGQPAVPEKEIVKERQRLEALLSKKRGDLRGPRRDLQDLMWRKAGIIRDREGLEGTLKEIRGLTQSLRGIRVENYRELIGYLELEHMVLMGEMVCRTALLRNESRGAHYRSDYPEEDSDGWLKNILIRRRGSEISLEAVPVPMTTVRV